MVLKVPSVVHNAGLQAPFHRSKISGVCLIISIPVSNEEEFPSVRKGKNSKDLGLVTLLATELVHLDLFIDLENCHSGANKQQR